MKSLDLGEVEIRGGPLLLAMDADVDDLERDLGTILPDGYREYVTRLGWGSLNTFVRVLPPAEIRAQLEQHRGLMAGYWFWDDAPDGIDQDWAMESLPIADTLDGDALAIHPANPERIVILPRNLERAFARDDGLLEAIEWICSGRVLRSFGPKRYFEPFGAAGEPADQSPAQPTPKAESKRERQAIPSDPPAASAREHLLAYFAALRDAEEQEVHRSGGPRAFTGRNPPTLGDFDEATWQVSLARFDAAHERFCTPRLATALSGSIVASWPPPHDPSNLEIREESTTSKGSAVFCVAESVASEFVQIVEYRLNPDGDGWRIASKRDLEIEDRPRRSFLSRLLRRSD